MTLPVLLQTQSAYVPFLKPLPVWDYWYLLILPLTAGVSIVYKSVKCRTMKQVPREAAVIAFWILAAMIGAAVGLALIVRLTEMTH